MHEGRTAAGGGHCVMGENSRVAVREEPVGSASGMRGTADTPDLDVVVAELRRSREITHNIREGGIARRLPSSTAIAEIVEGLSAVLFPTHYGQPELSGERIDGFVRGTLQDMLAALEEQLCRAQPPGGNTTERDAAGRIARDIAAAFAARLPAIRALLVGDLRAAYEGDPAATTVTENPARLSRHGGRHPLSAGARAASSRRDTDRAADLQYRALPGPASISIPAPRSGRTSSSITARAW